MTDLSELDHLAIAVAGTQPITPWGPRPQMTRNKPRAINQTDQAM